MVVTITTLLIFYTHVPVGEEDRMLAMHGDNASQPSVEKLQSRIEELASVVDHLKSRGIESAESEASSNQSSSSH